MAKNRTWILRAIPELQESIGNGHKTIEMLIETDETRWIIDQIFQYKNGDRLIIEYHETRRCIGSTETVVTSASTNKRIEELSEDEVKAIMGLLGETKEALIQFLNLIYRKVNVDENTKCHLVHFKMKGKK